MNEQPNEIEEKIQQRKIVEKRDEQRLHVDRLPLPTHSNVRELFERRFTIV